MNDDQEHDDAECGPAAAFTFDDGVRTPGVQAAMNAMTGPGVSSALGAHVAQIGKDLVSRHPALGFDAATVAGRFDFTTKVTGFESVSERVSAAAKSWVTSSNGAQGALTAAAAAGAAFKFDHEVTRTPGAQAALDAIANRAVRAGINGPLSSALSRTDLIGRHPGLDPVKGFDFTKLAGMPVDLESVSERVSAAAKSWMTSSNGAHGALTAATAAAAAFKFDDGVSRTPGAQAALNAIAGINGPLSSALSSADLIGRHPGLDPVKGFDFTKLAGMDPNGVSGALAAALKVHDGVSRLSGVQAALNALAGPGVSGLLGGDHAARFGIDWASGELGRNRHGLTGLMGVGGAMADRLSIFDKVMGDSQRAMHEAMGRWTSLTGPASWMTEAMRGWSTLADGGLWAARLALRMALAAKRAVLRGDIDAVRRFLCDWLDFTFEYVTLDLVNSASLVLLDERAWLPDDALALDYDPCPKLRKLTLAEHRSCTRLITDRQANYQPVISLHKPVTTANYSDSASPTSLLELVAAKPQPELVDANDDISDPRVLRVLAKLSNRERKIAEERGHVGTTWAEAAVACGGTADEGEKLRRKVKRLSKTAGGPAAARCRQWPDAGQQESVASQAAGT